MKLLISSAGEDIESNIDTAFHWSSNFLIINTLNNSQKVLVNRIKNHPNEVGDIINKIVKNEGIEAVITYEIGPIAFKIFKQNGVKIYQSRGKIIHAIGKLNEGKLSEITEV